MHVEIEAVRSFTSYADEMVQDVGAYKDRRSMRIRSEDKVRGIATLVLYLRYWISSLPAVVI